MIRIFFYISLCIGILSVLAMCYFQSAAYGISHPQFFSGIQELLLAFFIFGIMTVWWVIYFAITKDWKQLWVPLILIFIIVGAEVNFRIRAAIFENNYQTSLDTWFATTRLLNFESKNLGISFQYLSSTPFGGVVSVKEEGDTIFVGDTVSKTSDGGAIKVFSKDPSLTLLEYLNKKYKSNYPSCIFTDISSSTSTNSIVDMDRELGVGRDYLCPIIGIEVPHLASSYNFFISSKTHLDKYAFVSIPDDPVAGVQPKDRLDSGDKKWFQTIAFH